MGRSRRDNEMKTRAEHPRIVQLGELRRRRLRVIALSSGERYEHCVPTRTFAVWSK